MANAKVAEIPGRIQDVVVAVDRHTLRRGLAAWLGLGWVAKKLRERRYGKEE